MIWRNGDRYVGEWSNDTMNGSGILCMASGGKYDGEWFNGLVSYFETWLLMQCC